MKKDKILFSKQHFKVNYHIHGEKEWMIHIDGKRLITKEVHICNIPVVSKIFRGKAYFQGIGIVLFTEELTRIY